MFFFRRRFLSSIRGFRLLSHILRSSEEQKSRKGNNKISRGILKVKLSHGRMKRRRKSMKRGKGKDNWGAVKEVEKVGLISPNFPRQDD